MQTAKALEAVMEHLRDVELRETALMEHKAHLQQQRAQLEAKLKEEQYRGYAEQDDVPNGCTLHTLKGSNN